MDVRGRAEDIWFIKTLPKVVVFAKNLLHTHTHTHIYSTSQALNFYCVSKLFKIVVIKVEM